MQVVLKRKVFIKKIKRVLLFGLCLATFNVTAQKKLLYGFILDSSTHAAINNAVVSNEITRKSTSTNDKGFFSFSINTGDLIFISATGYHFDTLRCTALLKDTIFIYLRMLPHILPGVTVATKGYTKYQHDSIKRYDEFYKDLGLKRTAFSGADSRAGIALNLDYFSKKQRDKRRAVRNFKSHEKDEYINYRFPKDTVSLYTGLTGERLGNFMRLHTPSYDWLRAHTLDEDVFYYINDKLKLFFGRNK